MKIGFDSTEPSVQTLDSLLTSFFLYFQVWSLLELLGYSLLVTLAPLGRHGTVSGHKYALYITAAVVSGVTLLCSILLVVAAHKVSQLTIQ